MDESFRRKIIALLDQHRTMRIATLRPDGWPQVTTVGYANDGFAIYFLCGPDSQKASNLARDERVSLAIDDDPTQVMDITGLSMAARANGVADPAEAEKAMGLLMSRYPDQKGIDLPIPKPSEVRIFRLTPTVISVLDYSKGFGHTDLVAC
jgi:nitroimidazol reductase NimA-like FMN-containing flavoprotein (pyridoxamine 5'-phosphate oxidase superfamily)